MKDNLMLRIAISLLLPINLCLAADHLTPDASHISAKSGYAEKLRQTFSAGYEENSIFQVLAVPSSGVEFVVGVREGRPDNEVFFLIPKHRVSLFEHIEMISSKEGGWAHALPDNLPDSFVGNDVRMFRKKVDPQLTQRLSSIWKEALLDVRHEEKASISLDGIYYTFSMFLHGYGRVSGSVKNPRPNSKIYDLTRFVFLLKEYAQGSATQHELEDYVSIYERRYIVSEPAKEPLKPAR